VTTRRSKQKPNTQCRIALRVRRVLRSTSYLAVIALTTHASAQTNTRRATNLGALIAYPGFYHGRPIVVVGKVALEANGQLKVSDDEGAITVVFKGNAPDGIDEVRGEFWDLGRMKADDIRLNAYDLRTTFKVNPDDPWPRPGEVTAIIATAISPAAVPSAPTIRAIVLNPSRYIDQKVTITGQYSGRNLLGDLPEAPAKSRYDFALRSADAALWVVNIRPKLKDANGKDIELGLDARIDTGRWLSVTGTIRQGRGLLWLDADAASLAFARPPTETTEEEPIRVPAGPPPEVIFSTPTQEETDVSQSTTVRIQFSRDIDQSTLKGKIRVGYQPVQAIDQGAPPPAADFTFQYTGANRVLELRFAKPLERFRTLKIEMGDGILGTDGQGLRPWTLSFSLGGS
jgi:Bacterial Ig-like domain